MPDRRLSAREEQCLRLVGRLSTSKEIAAELGIEPGSVDVFIKRAMKKLGATDRRTAARMLAERASGHAVPEIGAIQTPVLYTSRSPASDIGTADDEIAFAEVREDRSVFRVAPLGASHGKAVGLIEALLKPPGDVNEIPARRRLALIFMYGIAMILAFSVLIIALLVGAVAYQQLRYS